MYITCAIKTSSHLITLDPQSTTLVKSLSDVHLDARILTSHSRPDMSPNLISCSALLEIWFQYFV